MALAQVWREYRAGRDKRTRGEPRHRGRCARPLVEPQLWIQVVIGMDRQIFIDGILREWWSSEARTVTTYDEQGVEVESRPYTADENETADAEVQAHADAEAARARAELADAILDATAALMADAHTDGQPWVQPTGAHDAYPLDITVTHEGKVWESLTPANVWEPGVSGWREQVAEGYPAWVQPTGAHDSYNKGDRVSFNDQDYESLIDGNTYSPSDYPAGWKTI